MAGKLLFLPQNHKNHPAAGVSASLWETVELHQIVQHGPKIDNFCAKNFPFESSPFPFGKTLVALLVAFTAADRFFKRLYGSVTKRAEKRCRPYMQFLSCKILHEGTLSLPWPNAFGMQKKLRGNYALSSDAVPEFDWKPKKKDLHRNLVLYSAGIWDLFVLSATFFVYSSGRLLSMKKALKSR